MKESKIVEEIAEANDFSISKAQTVWKSIKTILSESLIENDRVVIKTFGTFSKVQRKGRNGVNPRTGEKIFIAPSTNVKFKLSETIKNAIQ